MTAATAINLPRAEHHDHAVPLEVSIKCQFAGNDQSSLARWAAWPKRDIAVNKRVDTIRIARTKTRRTGFRSSLIGEISSLVYGCLLHSFTAIQKLSRARNVFQKRCSVVVTKNRWITWGHIRPAATAITPVRVTTIDHVVRPVVVRITDRKCVN